MGLESALNNLETFYFQTVQVRWFARNFRPLVSFVSKRQFAASRKVTLLHWHVLHF